MGKIRGTHSSPGIYTKFTDISYTAKSLGITTLGLVGETLKGPAFEPIAISSWTEYVQYFGGTSAEKFKGSNYPKYELPYIAKEYLSVSDQLYVCKVLGLSGYNAGPTFVIKAKGEGNKEYAIAVLRSRGDYKKYPKTTDGCTMSSDYDTLHYYCDYIKIKPYKNTTMALNGCDFEAGLSKTPFDVNSYNYGKFIIECYCGGPDTTPVGSYAVSLNVGDKDYIYNVLGSEPNDGNSSVVFVEDLYDVMLETEILNGNITEISDTALNINAININPIAEPVSDFVTISHDSLSRKNIGQVFLCTSAGTDDNGYMYAKTEDGSDDVIVSGNSIDLDYMEVGYLYMVSSAIIDGKKKYFYIQYKDFVSDASATGTTTGETYMPLAVGEIVTDPEGDWKERTVKAVKVLRYNRFYFKKNGTIVDQMTDMSDYREEFRCATTPWIVSEIKGNGDKLQVNKLFRFHTITDGNYANEQVKISIANIDTNEGTFDVYVRDFNDSDVNPVILEAYKNVTMKKGVNNYVGLKIGTFDGDYELKSKYVMIEIIENDVTELCVPCGFLGYPVRNFGDSNVESPVFKYNTNYDDEIAAKKQYFGLSDLTGVDADMLTYKGKNAYTERYYEGYTNPFHLDSRLSDTVRKQIESSGNTIVITIDGDMTTSGLSWEAVNPNNTTVEGLSPVIGISDEMEGTIYENKNVRKFTVYPCGGFDGWDIYRKSRTNTDEFKASRYKGSINKNYGKTFSAIDNAETLALSGNCITSDYYAYLAGVNQFENPEKVRINLFATPGIDYVNNKMLSIDVLNMIEESRGDSVYVMTTPDKPAGVSDSVSEMYTANDAIQNLEDSEIDTYYACTYYPNVKFFDKENSKYINLPVTKDVLRNMADVDNKKYPWYAPAGIERGNVNCEKARIFSKIDNEDTLYDGRINPVKTFSKDGVKIWGNKTMYTGDTPMNRVNVVRLMLYMRQLIIESTRGLIFEPNDTTLKSEFEGIVKPILEQIQKDRGITAFRLNVSQTPEEMDAHELSCTLFVKPTPTLEYIEINFVVTPQGVDFDSI